MLVYKVREGVTDPIIFRLQESDDGALAGVDLTAVTEIVLHQTAKRNGRNKAPLSLAGGQIALVTPHTGENLGKITVSPTTTAFLYTDIEYSCYFRVTDGAGKIVDFPSEERFTIEVLKANA